MNRNRILQPLDSPLFPRATLWARVVTTEQPQHTGFVVTVWSQFIVGSLLLPEDAACPFAPDAANDSPYLG